MIGALAVALVVCADAASFTWRVSPASPRVGDRVVLEGVLDPSPRGEASVADPGLAPGLIDDGAFEWRREGARLVLSRAYVVAASGAVDLPRTRVQSGEADWVASASRIDVTVVEPGRRGRVVIDPLAPVELPEAPASSSTRVWWFVAAAIGLSMVVLALLRTRARGALVAAPVPSVDERLRARLDELARAFDAGELPVSAAATALRDLLRDAWAERTREPARARTSDELDALVRASAANDAAFCIDVFDEVEALCYAERANLARDRVAAWLLAARAWLAPARGAA